MPELLARLNRRQFMVKGTITGAGIIIGLRLAGSLHAAQEDEKGPKKPAPNPFDAWVHIKPDGRIFLIVAKSEMGQGIRTGLAMVLADEIGRASCRERV